MEDKIRKSLMMFKTHPGLTYILLRGNPSELSKDVEGILSKLGARYNRLVDPDCHSLRAYVTAHFGENITLIEIRGNAGKVFYVVPGLSDVELSGLQPEFILRFITLKEKGLDVLTDYICRGKITKRHAHRSSLIFVVSTVTGFLGSLLGESFGFYAQFIVGALVLLAVLLLLEYPLSLLSLKGVRIEEKVRVKVFVVKKGKKD